MGAHAALMGESTGAESYHMVPLKACPDLSMAIYTILMPC